MWICFLNKNNLHRKAMYQGNCKILPYQNTIFYSKQIKSWIEKAWEHGQWYDSSRSIKKKKKICTNQSKIFADQNTDWKQKISNLFNKL